MVPAALYILVEEVGDSGLGQLVLAFYGGEHAERVAAHLWIGSGGLTDAEVADVQRVTLRGKGEIAWLVQVEVTDHSLELRDPVLLLLERFLQLACLLPGLVSSGLERLHIVAETFHLLLPVVALVEHILIVGPAHNLAILLRRQQALSSWCLHVDRIEVDRKAASSDHVGSTLSSECALRLNHHQVVLLLDARCWLHHGRVQGPGQ